MGWGGVHVCVRLTLGQQRLVDAVQQLARTIIDHASAARQAKGIARTDPILRLGSGEDGDEEGRAHTRATQPPPPLLHTRPLLPSPAFAWQSDWWWSKNGATKTWSAGGRGQGRAQPLSRWSTTPHTKTPRILVRALCHAPHPHAPHRSMVAHGPRHGARVCARASHRKQKYPHWWWCEWRGGQFFFARQVRS